MNKRRNILKLTLGAAGLLVLPQAIELAKATEDFIRGPRVKDHPDRKSTRLNSSHSQQSRMPSSA